MYTTGNPTPTGSDQQHRYNNARAKANAILDAKQLELVRATELDTRPDTHPLTALERLELASLCAALASAFSQAAAAWDDEYQPHTAISASYRHQALELYDRSARNEALADIAPATTPADPFAR